VTGALITFYAFGALALAGAILTITRKNPVSAALFLVLTLVSTGGVYLALHATFLAAIQVLVYAGAIMVLFIFVVMSVGKPDDNERVSLLTAWPTKLLGLLAIGALVFRIAMVVGQKELAGTRAVAANYGSVEQMGRLLFTDYLFPFEAISILLLVAIVGAVMITRRPAADATRQEGGAR
jgi:NADH-quinone oxidoreductase subunit J